MTANNSNSAEQSQQYDDNMRGVLYKNNQKTEAKHPGARGRAMIDNVWFWVSSWTQHTKATGERYQSLAFTKMTDEEVQKYINKAAPVNNTAQQNSQNGQQSHQEHNPDGSARPTNEPPMDFDRDIPF
jgi:hypothetical protein